MSPTGTPADRIRSLRDALPADGLFHEKEWRLTPEPFALDSALVEEINRLGPRLEKFVRACNELYHRSVKGSAPEWVARWLDAGKPDWLIALGRERALRNAIPQVLRPDLVLTAEGFCIAELDSVPGGIGLTAWLNRQYSKMGYDVLGGPEGMLDGFDRIMGSGDILVSKEAATYRPEMDWLATELNQRPGRAGSYRVLAAEEPITGNGPIYRFFEHFDWPNLPTFKELGRRAVDGVSPVTPPFKPFLEEKMWFAFFWMKPLEAFWIRELGQKHFDALRRVIPFTWLLNPEPLPPQAVHPRLNIQNWEEAKTFSKKDRELIIKVSGFSEIGWGSRSVVAGHDASLVEWSKALDDALRAFPQQPYLLQVFHHPRLVRQPVLAADGETEEEMTGRVRLCPYYFVGNDPRAGDNVTFGGALATICPPDKKLLHGMKDAILAPAAEQQRMGR